MNERPEPYIPALKYERLTALYDPVLRWTMREAAFKQRLVQQAGIEAGHRVLDLGAGTGTLTLLVKRLHPEAEVVGLDGDEQVLAIARAKAEQAALAVSFDRGLASDLPYPDHSFDRVLSSLVFHHLTRDQKERALREVRRVLRPGGELHVADWGKPPNRLLRAAFLLVQVLDGFETTSDNVAGRLPDFFRRAGFSEVRQTTQFATVFGALSLYQAR